MPLHRKGNASTSYGQIHVYAKAKSQLYIWNLTELLLSLPKKEGIMSIAQVSNSQMSTLDALWVLFKSQPSAVRMAFVHRLEEDVKAEVSDYKFPSRTVRAVNRTKGYSDAALEKLLSENPDISSIPEADVPQIVAGGKGKALNSFKHWL